MHPSRQGRRLGGGGVGWWMDLPVHLCGRGGPPAGLPCGSQIPSYSSLSVRSLRDLDHHVTACSEGAKACWGGGGGAGPAFGPALFLLGGGGGGSKRSAPLFPGPQGEPAHGLHPRFVVAEIWADRGGGGGYEKKWVLQKKNFLPMSHVPHIITVFLPHNMPLLLVGIPLCGYFGY